MMRARHVCLPRVHAHAFSSRVPRARCRFLRCAQVATGSTKQEYKHRLPNGLNLEVIKVPRAEGVVKRQDLLFLHGSFHGAWCWQEKFVPYFSGRGHDCYAMSWRGQGGSDREGPGVDEGTFAAHLSDLDSFVSSLETPPIVVGHSFAGIIMEKYMLSMADGDSPGYSTLAGAAFLCCMPPSGNNRIVSRFLKRDLMLSFRITWGMVTKSFARSAATCRELFFSADLPEEELIRYQAQLARCSPVRIMDLRQMNRELPLPPAPSKLPPIFVLGGENDNLVDPPAVQELAAYYGVQPVMVANMAHDVMLDARWQVAADALAEWMAKL